MADANIDRADNPEPCKFEVAGGSVSGLWAEAIQPIAVAVMAHGAGAGMNHPFMAGVAQGLAEGGVSVLRFNFPYLEARRRAPDPAPVLLETWKAVLQQTSGRGSGLPIVVGGKSMGGRIASMLAATQGSDFRGTALLFFGYPLHAPGRMDHLRDAHLTRVRRPMVFIQGTRDSLARLDLMEALVKRLQPLARLHLVVGGDHAFRVKGVRCSDRENGRVLGRIASEYVGEIVNLPIP